MPNPDQFTTCLNHYVQRSAYTPGQLASLTSVPKTTIVNWLNGRVVRPRDWQGIVEIAAALRLTPAEADELLAAAQHPGIRELQTITTDKKMQGLFAFWTATASTVPSPFQAIALPPYLVGRDDERMLLRSWLTADRHTAVTCLNGMAGVGKTSLAAQLAYDLRAHFADGVLWARLDSSDTMSILASFAEAWQRDVSHYYDVDSRSRVVRDLLRSKRVLIVLDNAQASEQIEPLLPPTGPCAVLVTTRRQDLAILAGARRLELRPFAPDATTSLALFEKILGPSRVQADPAALRQIAEDLGHLPLALVITASRLAYEPGWQTAEFGQRLQRVNQRLRALRYESHSVRRSFQLSYDLLEPASQQLFATLGLLGRHAFTSKAAAALLAWDEETAVDGLRQLYSLSLVQGGADGRYQLHPLLHDFALSLAAPDAAARRLVDYWTDFVAARRYDHAAVVQELAHVTAALQTAVMKGWERPLLKLLDSIEPFLLMRGAHEQAAHYLELAQPLLAAAQDEEGLAWLWLWRGRLEQQRHNLTAAEWHLQAGLELAQKHGQTRLMARLLTELGIVYNCQEVMDKGQATLLAALPLAHQAADLDSLLPALEELGILALISDDMTAATQYQQEGLALARQHGHDSQAVLFHKSLGALAHLAQDTVTAWQHFAAGYALARQIGFRKGEMLLDNNLGVLAFLRGETAAAEAHLQASRAEAERLNDFQALSQVLQNLARLARHNGHFAESRAFFYQLRTLAQQCSWPDRETAVQQELILLAEIEQENRRGHAEHLKVFI